MVLIAVDRNIRRHGVAKITTSEIPSNLVDEGYFSLVGGRVSLSELGKTIVKKYSEREEKMGIEEKLHPTPVRRGFSFVGALNVLSAQYARKPDMSLSEVRRGWFPLEGVRRVWGTTYKEMNVIVDRQVWITSWVKGRIGRGGLPPDTVYIFGKRAGHRAFGSKGATHVKEIEHPPEEFFK